jgi:RNA recognition motif-containing protein
VAKKLYVGNVPWTSTEDELKSLFSTHGEVKSVVIVKDRETGRSRGFSFVEMENADAAMNALNNTSFGGKNLKINEAMERPPRR